MTADETCRDIVEALRKLDDIEQMIFLAGVRALAAKRMTADGFTAWVDDRVGRHRAGEELLLSGLELEGAA